MMKIRPATTNDITSLLSLVSELGYPSSLDDLTYRLEKFLQNPGYGVVVCEINKDIAGLVAWSKSDIFVADKTRFHIEALVVADEHRGKAIGKSLMGFVEEVARQNGPAIVDLTSGLRRAEDGSHEFYKKLGYANEGYMAKLYLRKEL